MKDSQIFFLIINFSTALNSEKAEITEQLQNANNRNNELEQQVEELNKEKDEIAERLENK